MPSARRSCRLAAAATLSTGLVAATLAAGLAPASANPAGTELVISEAYGGGGNSGATYTHDFIELYNPTDADISVDGMSVQYRSSSGSGTGSTDLTGSVPAGGHYLIQQAQGTGGTEALPTPDATGTLAMSGSNGSVALTEGTGTQDPAGSVDLVGYGTATLTETAPATGASNTQSVSRDAAGTDTDNNSVDFTAQAPDPQNSAGGGGGDPEPEPDPEPQVVEIAEIQGTGDTSPMSGDTVTTRGVVTAAYPTGGLNGFYIQTEGTGGAIDPEAHDASDGIFVYRGSRFADLGAQPGDHVEVTGQVSEYAGATQLSAFDAEPSPVTVLDEPADPVTAATGPWPATAEDKEALEGMLVRPDGPFTITDNYSTNSYGELGLARGEQPLIQPTQVARPRTAGAAAVAANNEARRIVLDDASSLNFTSSANQDLTPPYISNDTPFRVGATGAFATDLILTEGGSPSSPTYRLQPLQPVVGPANAETPITFPDTRTQAPDMSLIDADGQSTVQVASFNVLNYFTTLGDADDDNVGDGGCQAYEDRDGDGNNVRGGCDQRGAWDPQDLDRQQAKIVSAINALEADVVGLMEIENSAALGEETDEAVQTLVDALNADAGAGTWAANPSSADLPPAAQQDVITNAIIYRTAAVERVGTAHALGDQSEEGEAFGNAREPIGQAFASVDGGDPFLVVVNHFKSKGSEGPFPGDTDDGSGQGNSNESRVRQAEALAAWVPGVQEAEDVEKVLLLGDFNSYAKEDPMRLLYSEGYTNLETQMEDPEFSYSFSGLSGSLDHVLANDAALASFTGADVWDINADEPVAMEYSRWNYHGTDFHTDGPYRSSDHDPVVAGLDLTAETEEPVLADSRTKLRVKRKVTVRKRVKAVVRVGAPKGIEATGQVTLKVKGATRTKRLRDGRATFRVGPWRQPGKVRVVARYAGSDELAPSRDAARIRVVRRRR